MFPYLISRISPVLIHVVLLYLDTVFFLHSKLPFDLFCGTSSWDAFVVHEDAVSLYSLIFFSQCCMGFDLGIFRGIYLIFI